jgi:hypothetical protein
MGWGKNEGNRQAEPQPSLEVKQARMGHVVTPELNKNRPGVIADRGEVNPQRRGRALVASILAKPDQDFLFPRG